MYFDFEFPNELKRTVFTAIVTPRPIGWISTVDAQGIPNLAPFSYFNLVSTAPPVVMFAVNAAFDRTEKDTVANVKQNGEFVYNLATVPLLQQMVKSSAPEPHGVDEFDVVGLEKAPSVKVRPPRVLQTPVAFECKVMQIVELTPQSPGETTSHVVFGRVVGVHIAEGFLQPNGRFDTIKAQPVSRLGGTQYAELGRIFDVPAAYVRPV